MLEKFGYTKAMLKMSKSLFNVPVVSLRLGGPIAIAESPVINPHNLKIIGWWCSIPGKKKSLVLMADEVREIMPTGIAVNDDDALCEPEDLVRHHDILEIDFQLIDKAVRTKRQKIGKVSDFNYNDGLYVQKLYVSRPLIKVFTSEDTLIIDRNQILEVTDKHILVRDTEVKATEKELSGAVKPALS